LDSDDKFLRRCLKCGDKSFCEHCGEECGFVGDWDSDGTLCNICYRQADRGYQPGDTDEESDHDEKVKEVLVKCSGCEQPILVSPDKLDTDRKLDRRCGRCGDVLRCKSCNRKLGLEEDFTDKHYDLYKRCYTHRKQYFHLGRNDGDDDHEDPTIRARRAIMAMVNREVRLVVRVSRVARRVLLTRTMKRAKTTIQKTETREMVKTKKKVPASCSNCGTVIEVSLENLNSDNKLDRRCEKCGDTGFCEDCDEELGLDTIEDLCRY
jgi:hypothetical protein